MTNWNGVLVRSNILRRNGTVTPIHFTNRNAVPVRSGPFRALLGTKSEYYEYYVKYIKLPNTTVVTINSSFSKVFLPL